MRTEKKLTIAVFIFALGFLSGLMTLGEIQDAHPLLTYLSVITMFLLALIFAYKKID